MTNGYVNRNLHGVIPIDIFDHRNRLRRIDVIIDTGFDDFLALPINLVQNLGLPRAGEVPMRVATGELEDFDTMPPPYGGSGAVSPSGRWKRNGMLW